MQLKSYILKKILITRTIYYYCINNNNKKIIEKTWKITTLTKLKITNQTFQRAAARSAPAEIVYMS